MKFREFVSVAVENIMRRLFVVYSGQILHCIGVNIPHQVCVCQQGSKTDNVHRVPREWSTNSYHIRQTRRRLLHPLDLCPTPGRAILNWDQVYFNVMCILYIGVRRYV